MGLAILWPRFLTIVLLVAMIGFYYLLARDEERRMVSQFGDQYRDYMVRTGMFFPRSVERTFGRLLPLHKMPMLRSLLGFAILALVAVGGAFALRAYTVAQLPLWSQLSGQLRFPVSRGGGAVALVLFVALFPIPLILSSLAGHQAIALFEAFYRSGALVFGGGHVVLPLLQAQVVAPGWVTNETFLAGYGLAQAVPGPLFTFAAYLGAVMGPTPNGIAGAAIALVAIFLPGLLLVYGMLPFWDELRTRQFVQAAMRGANAAVVGILGLALYNPIWTSAVLTPRDFALAVGGFLLLTVWKAPPWVVVMLLAAAGTLLAATHYS